MTAKIIKTKEQEERILELYKIGKSTNEIGQGFNCSPATILKVLHKYEIKLRYNDSEKRTSEQLATMRKYKVNQDYFEKIDNHDKAYWLGFLFADGYVLDKTGENAGKRKGMVVGIALKEDDVDHLYNFRKAISSNHPIHKKIIKLKGKEYGAYTINIGSVKMALDLISLGCTPRKSLTLKYPEKLNDKFFPSFLRGYIDGDGCIFASSDGKSKVISMLGTLEFLTSIKEMLEKYNILCWKDLPKNNKSKNNTHILSVSALSYDNLFDLLYKKSKSTYMMGRKYEMFQRIGDLRHSEDYDLSKTAALSRLIK